LLVRRQRLHRLNKLLLITQGLVEFMQKFLAEAAPQSSAGHADKIFDLMKPKLIQSFY
jgi:hypothetical protein